MEPTGGQIEILLELSLKGISTQSLNWVALSFQASCFDMAAIVRMGAAMTGGVGAEVARDSTMLVKHRPVVESHACSDCNGVCASTGVEMMQNWIVICAGRNLS